MTNNKKSTAKRFFKNFALLTVLAFCFITVFAFAIQSDLNFFDSSDINGQIASADDVHSVGGYALYYPDETVTPGSFGFPGASSRTSWTFTTHYNGILDSGNASAYLDSSSSNDIRLVNSGKGVIGMQESEKSGWNNGTLYGVINIGYSDFISNLAAKNTNVTVKATATALVTRLGGDDIGLGLTASDGAKTAASVGSSINYTKANESSKTFTTSAVTLTAQNPSLILGWYLSRGWSTQGGAKISQITITYTLTMPSTVTRNSSTLVYDNSAPVFSSYSLNEAAPYRPNGVESENWPVFNNIVKQSTDTLTEKDAELMSFTSSPLGTKSGKNYYKTLKLNVADTYSYGITEKYTDSDGVEKTREVVVRGDSAGVDSRYFSGIKSILIGEENGGSGAIFYSYNGLSQHKEIYIRNENEQMIAIGYAEVVFAQNYITASFKIYMYSNADLKYVISDYGGLSLNKSILISGIDTQAPVLPSLDDSEKNISLYTGSAIDPSAIKWINTSSITFNATDNITEEFSDKAFSPYFWYYSVQKSTTISGLGSPVVYTFEQLSKKMTPFATGQTLNDFTYNFDTGTSLNIGNGDGLTENVTGAGYYLFTFYVLDAAGNLQSESVSYYAKVDYEPPEYGISAKYIKQGNVQSIEAPSNGAWATGTLNVSLEMLGDFSGESFSGNCLVFEGLDDKEHTVVLKDGKIVSVDGVIINATEYTLNNVDVKYVYTPGINAVLTFTYGKYINNGQYDIVDKLILFTAYVGTDTEAEVPTFFNENWKYNKGTEKDPDFEYGIWVRVDKNKPENPTIFENLSAELGQGFLQDGDNGGSLDVAAGNRIWYTASWKLPVKLSLIDNTIASYGSDIKVYIAMKHQGFATEFENGFSSYSDSLISVGRFDKLNVITGNLLESEYEYEIDLLQKNAAGMRVFYVWTVDQAGNTSDLTTYCILSDAFQYTVKTSTDNGVFVTKNADITQKDLNGGDSIKFKRGETVYIGINLASGYAPYAFTRFDSNNLNGMKLLFNDGLNQNFTVNEGCEDYISASGLDIEVKMDAADLTSLSTGDIEYKFKYRKIVDYVVTNTSVMFTDAEAVIPMTIGGGDYDTLYGSFSFEFKQLVINEDSGESEYVPISFVPKDIGIYKLSISINTESYIGLSTEDIDFSIVKINAVIKAKATAGVYGDAQSLDYEIVGLTASDAEAFSNGTLPIKGSLKLNTSEPDYKKLKVGQYAVIQNEAFELDNYTFTFESALHSVQKRDISAVISSAQNKIFGDADPVFKFTVDTNQYVNGDECADIFLNCYIYNPGDMGSVHIRREDGENVGFYHFYDDTEGFEINPNYNLILNADAAFEISQRHVTITAVNNQFAIFNEMPDAEDLNNINVEYSLGGNDLKIAQYVTGNLELEPSGREPQEVNGYTVYYYTVNLGTIRFNTEMGNPENILFSLFDSESRQFEIRVPVEGKNNVVIQKKENVSGDYFVKYYNGKAWNPVSSLPFDYSQFTVTGLDENSDYAISWQTSLIGASSTGVAGVGSYGVSVGSISIKNADGADVTASFDSVSVLPFKVVINPARIGLVPKPNNNEKIYGNNDTVYGISYDVHSINGITENLSSFGFYSSLLPSDSNSNIIGAFTRGIYTADGMLVALGTQFDAATDLNGNTVDGSGRYYGVAEGIKFKSASGNYDVFVDYDAVIGDNGFKVSDIRFLINPKPIDLSAAVFSGYGKAYDGNNTAIYPSGMSPVDLIPYLARTADDVTLVYSAIYNSSDIGKRSITFSGLSLSGAQADNYVLKKGADYITEETTFVIDKKLDGSDIYITEGEIKLSKNDITLKKQYDGTVYLGVEHISFSENSGLSNVIKQFDGNASYSFASPEITNNFSVSYIVLFIPDDNPEKHFTINRENMTSDIEIEIVETGEKKGIRITIFNLSGKIVPREITPESFAFIDAVDRDYNGGDEVTISYTFKNTALGAGDSADNVGLVFTARAENKNAGAVNAAGIIPTQVIFESAAVGNANYYVDKDVFNEYFADSKMTVAISKAKIMPSVSFNEAREYDSSTLLIKGTDVFGDGALTVLNYADMLADELGAFSFDWDSVVFEYSQNGRADKNVMTDAEGKIVRHHIMVRGLIITEAGGNDYLANYELYGFIYDAVTGNYGNLAGTEFAAFEGAEKGFGVYELLNFAPMKKRQIYVADNDITIKTKFYDGTTSAEYSVKKSYKFVESEKDKIEVELDAEFKNINAGENVPVSVSNPRLVNIASDGIDYTFNYSVNSDYEKTLEAIIKRAPVVMTTSLGSKVYDGSVEVSTQKIDRTLEGLYTKDVAYYSVNIGSAAFDDKNVAVDENDEIVAKSGHFYNLQLKNSQDKQIINYILTYKTESQTIDPNAYYSKNLGGVFVNYYELKTSRTYISVSDYDNLSEEDKALCDNNKLGTYIYSNGSNSYNVYLLNDEMHELINSSAQFDKSINISDATGVIKKKSITISVVKPDNYSPAEDFYNKPYDGTSHFDGTLGADYVVSKTVSGIVGDDVVYPSDVKGVFSQINAGPASVIFSASKFVGNDAVNYDIKSATSTINDASIKKIEITAKLNDDIITYGSQKVIFSNISYSLKGFPLLTDGKLLYMVCADYLSIFNSLTEDAITSERYNSVNGVFIQDNGGTYVKLSGNFRLPTGQTSVNALKSVGVYEYTLGEGSATNFTFKPDYTDTERNVSKITIERAAVYVYPEKIEYNKIYGSLSPTIGLAYSASADSSANGLKNNEDAVTAFGAGNVPYAEFRLYSEASGWAAEAVGKHDIINSRLDAGQFYGVYIVIPEGADGGNYKVMLRYTNPDDFGRLIISLPTIDNITAQNKSVAYTGLSPAVSLLRGLQSNDVISYVFYKSENGGWIKQPENTTPVNVGHYKLDFTICRDLENDVNGYYAQWSGSAELTITAAKLGMSADIITENYDFKVKEFDTNYLNFAVQTGLNLSDIKISYAKRVTSVDSITGRISYSYQDVASMSGAGTYRVKLVYDPTDSDLQTAVPENFTAETAYVTYIISPITVAVSKTSSLKQVFDSENGNRLTYAVALTEEFKNKFDTDIIPSTQIEYYRYSSGQNQDEKTDISRPGRYTYIISFVADAGNENFKLIGDTSGILEIGSLVLQSVANETVKAVMSVGENGSSIIAEKLEYREIFADNVLSKDDVYWTAINGFMGAIGSDSVPATLKSVVRLSLTYNNSSLQPGETVNMKVAIPETVGEINDKTVIYYVTATGALERLSNYQIEGEYIVYDTDYVSSLVFVELGETMPTWQIIVIAVGAAAGAAAIALVSLAIVRSAKRKKAGISLDDE